MNSATHGSRARPVFRILVAFPIACFSGALVTDIAYAATADMIWSDFSDWLLAAAMFTGVLSAIAGIAYAVTRRREPGGRGVLPVAAGGVLVLGLGLLDNLVHSRDAWTSVVPQGLLLSAVILAVMLVTAWFGFAAPPRVAPVAYTRPGYPPVPPSEARR